MPKPNYDDPDVEERWCDEQKAIVAEYLRSQRLEHGRIGEWPAWHVAPYASICHSATVSQTGADHSTLPSICVTLAK